MEHMYGSKRRATLWNLIARDSQYDDVGAILVVGAFEQSGRVYVPDAYMRYYTGITQPGTCLLMYRDGSGMLFEPSFAQDRSQWVSAGKSVGRDSSLKSVPLGAPFKSYSPSLWAPIEHFSGLVSALQEVVHKNQKIGLLSTPSGWSETMQTLYMRMAHHDTALHTAGVDVGLVAAYQRSVKSPDEIKLIQDAVDVTLSAQAAVLSALADEQYTEKSLAAFIESFFLVEGDGSSFEPIVAQGAHAAVLHYTPDDYNLNEQELVLVDIGARKAGYCGDITRTYPGDGQQYPAVYRQWYDLVYEAQQYAESITKPGMWLNNRSKPEQSVHHMVIAWFAKHKVDAFFVHGIGHYLGLEVHDVGDYSKPLEAGMVLTLEPGLYSAQKKMGIRIEDNYVVTDKGVRRLSQELPQDARGLMELADSLSQMAEEPEDDWQ